MIDPNNRRIIDAMRPIEAAHAAEEKPFEWTEAAVRAIRDNPEVTRLTSAPAASAEVERLAALAREVSKHTT